MERETIKIRWQNLGVESLHLLTLWTFAVAQPLYAMLGRQEGYFTASQADRLDLIIFVLGLSFVIPAIGILFKELVGLFNSSLRDWVHYGLIILLAFLTALPALIRLSIPDFLMILIALGMGVLAFVLYKQKEKFREYLTWLGALVLFFPLSFLFFTNVTSIFIGHHEASNLSVNQTSKRQPPVIMVIFDELPVTTLLDKDGNIDAERYPNFGELASQSWWFKNTYTVGGSTLFAVPAILSGQYPTHKTVHTQGELSVNLFTLLKDTHRYGVIAEKHTTLCQDPTCKPKKKKRIKEFFKSLPDLYAIYLHRVSPPGFVKFLPDVSNNWSGFTAAPVEHASEAPPMAKPQAPGAAAKKENFHIDPPTTRPGKEPVAAHKWGSFNRFVRSLKPDNDLSEKPPLNFIHIIFPHVPYSHMASGKYYRVGPYKYFTTWQNNREIYFDFQRYMLQLGATDALLGNLITRLKELDLYDKSMVIVMADHGASWTRPGEERRMLNDKNYRDIVRVPLFIKMPGQTEMKVIDRPFRTIDLLPTIADFLKLKMPGKVNGQSFFSKEYPDVQSVRVMDNLGKQTWTFDVLSGYQSPSWVNMNRWFGTGKRENIFLSAPCPQFIGKPVDAHAVRTSETWQFRLADAAPYKNVDLADEFIPTLVEGKIYATGSALPENPVIAVNGTIWNCYPLLVRDEDNRGLVFGGMVPEESLKAGKNTIRIFNIENSQLVEIPVKAD